MWAEKLHHPCYLGGPQQLSRGVNREWLGGPHAGKTATSPLLSRVFPKLIAGCKSKMARCLGKIATSPLLSRGSPALIAGTKSQMAR